MGDTAETRDRWKPWGSERTRAIVHRLARFSLPLMLAGILLGLAIPDAGPYWGLLLAACFGMVFARMLLDPWVIARGRLFTRSALITRLTGAVGLLASAAIALIALGAIVVSWR